MKVMLIKEYGENAEFEAAEQAPDPNEALEQQAQRAMSKSKPKY